jgi:flavin reductase (DIM6/NTAB) family NADH-FMN oxidoreductase RutF
MKRISPEEGILLKFPEWVGMLITRDPDLEGRPNVMPCGWVMCCSFDPLMIAISVGLTRYSHQCLIKTGKFVLAFAGEGQGELVRESGAMSGHKDDKFTTLRIRYENSPEIGYPLLPDAAVNFECEVTDSLRTGDHTIFAARILAAYVPDRPIRKIENFGQDRYVPAQPAV